MRARRLLRLGLHLGLWGGLAVWGVVTVVTSAHGMQIGGLAALPVELAPAQVDRVSNATRTRLEQVRSLAANQSWVEAIDILISLSTDASSGVVDLGDDRFASLATYCQLQISRMPPDALEEYRRRVDAAAENLYRNGVAARDHRLLRRAVREYYCSSWGDDALWALGELALEQGDYSAARRWWEQISPLLRDPSGLPVWLALREIDLDAHWPQVERRWNQRSHPPTWQAYPDTGLDLAQVRAWLVVASIRSGEWERATIELAAFRHWHPQATGQLGGQSGTYAAALDRLYATAHEWPAEPLSTDWPTFAGSPARSPHAAPIGPLDGAAWTTPVTFSPPAVPSNASLEGRWLAGDVERDGPRIPVRESQHPLTCFPVSVDGMVAFNDGTQIAAVDLETGQPTVTRDGRLYRGEPGRAADTIEGFGIRGRANQLFMNIEPSSVQRHTLSVAGNVLYGRVGRAAAAAIDTSPESTSERLIGLDLERDGQLTFRVRPDSASWSFDGAPIGDLRRIFVAARDGAMSPRAHVICFDVATGNELWRTYIGTADAPGAGQQQYSHNLLTLVGDRLYYSTSLGFVAALDTDDGRICWVRGYERRTSQPTGVGRAKPLHYDRAPAPCLYHGGLLVAAPSDTQCIFCLDAETGQMLWSNDQLPDVLHLLGVVRDNLIVGGNRLAALDIGNGTLKFIWPESETAGIRGMGRGLIAGEEVFWPTRTEIYVMDGGLGGLRRPPIPLGDISDCGANLAAARGRLIAAGYDKIMAWGPTSAVPASGGKSEEAHASPTAATTTATRRFESKVVFSRRQQ